jgi:hypothetical protein
MPFLSPFLTTKFALKNRFKVMELMIFSYWYLSLFPGRLGFDGSEGIRMIQRGESTDWWTASFFWFLKILSFNGQSIFLASLVSYLFLAFSLKYFVFSLPAKQSILRRTYLVMLATPIVSAFGLTVSHDALQVAGTLILIGTLFRNAGDGDAQKSINPALLVLAYSGLLTTRLGIFIVILDILFRLKFSKKIGFLLLGYLVLFLSISSVGISKHEASANTNWMLADLKCVTQHPEARLSPGDWLFLETIAPKVEWKIPLSCTTVDEPVGLLKSKNSEAHLFSREFAGNYIKIVSKNPAIVAMAHIQRSRGALPPPFFQGPDNQVELDTSIPIGQGTNIALQNSFEMLHPSIDEPSVKHQIKVLKPLESLSQMPIFLVNQASWFWGWGGMWLWPAFYLALSRNRTKTFTQRIGVYSPILVLHFLLVVIAPSPLSRYVMAAVICGLTSFIILIFEWLNRIKKANF